MDLPSGVQSVGTSDAGDFVTLRGVPPVLGTMKMSLLPLRLDEKAIHLPSGEKTGLPSNSAWAVRGDAVPPVEAAM